jgi:hypothetical protein
LEEVGQGRFSRVLFSLTMRLREKIFLFTTDLFYYSTSFQTLLPPKRWNHTPPTLPPCRISSPFSPPSRLSVFGWLLHSKYQSAVIKDHDIFYFILLLLSLPPQTMVWRLPHTFCPGCAPSPISLLPRMPTFGWLLCCPSKRWPPKAKVTSLSLIFDVLHFGAPKEGTNRNKIAPNTARLVWAHKDQQRQDVGPWRMLPWQKMAKPLEGRAMAAHVGCCLFCVFCVLCFV